jgi:hypothetical protein
VEIGIQMMTIDGIEPADIRRIGGRSNERKITTNVATTSKPASSEYLD